MTDKTEKKPAKTKDSASVLIIRDGETHPRFGTLQILMVKRHQKIKFAGGAYVFPGGKLDEADRALEQQDQANATTDISAEFRGLRYAALREVFEETGLIIGTQEGKAIDEPMRRKLDETYRDAILEDRMTLAEFMDHSRIILDMNDCFPFAHWITPEVYPIRFDTRFFLCVAPEGQEPSPDGHEITEVEWMYPMSLVEESDGVLMFPTMMNLKMLGQAKSVTEALDLLTKRKIVTVTPEVIEGDKLRFREIPADAGYEEVDQTRTRAAIDLKKG